MTYVFIINPVAGNGRAERVFSQIKQSQEYKEISSLHFFTEYLGHATEIATQVIKDSKNDIACVIVIGGDGTLHEVLNGLSIVCPIGFIPGGSGNDFARGCNIKGKPMTLFRRILADEPTTSYWLGNYQTDNENERHFVNSVGFGFDAMVAKAANKSYYKRLLNFLHVGTLNYVIALISILFKFQPMSVELVVNGKTRNLSNCWMVTITNHPYYGGGMKIIPHAKVQPSEFPVLLIHSISKWKILAVFMTVFLGKHIHFKEVELLHATRLIIKSDQTIHYQVDGQTGNCKSCAISKQNLSNRVRGSVNVPHTNEDRYVNS